MTDTHVGHDLVRSEVGTVSRWKDVEYLYKRTRQKVTERYFGESQQNRGNVKNV
jgi:hypothetical protein